jgi:hypothetical protein
MRAPQERERTMRDLYDRTRHKDLALREVHPPAATLSSYRPCRFRPATAGGGGGGGRGFLGIGLGEIDCVGVSRFQVSLRARDCVRACARAHLRIVSFS